MSESARESLRTTPAPVLRVVADSTLVLAVLAGLAWITDLIAVVDIRLLLAMAIATLLAQLALHRVFPWFFARVFSADAMRRTAVIAGVNQTGCLLARHVDRDPHQPTCVAGYFDDREPARLAGVTPREV